MPFLVGSDAGEDLCGVVVPAARETETCAQRGGAFAEAPILPRLDRKLRQRRFGGTIEPGLRIERCDGERALRPARCHRERGLRVVALVDGGGERVAA